MFFYEPKGFFQERWSSINIFQGQQNRYPNNCRFCGWFLLCYNRNTENTNISMRWKSYPKKKYEVEQTQEEYTSSSKYYLLYPLTDTSIEIHPQQFKNDDEH